MASSNAGLIQPDMFEPEANSKEEELIVLADRTEQQVVLFWQSSLLSMSYDMKISLRVISSLNLTSKTNLQETHVCL